MMNNMKHHQEDKEIEGLSELLNDYRVDAKEQPSATLDRQIIAAAHREIAHPNKRTSPKLTWWRRLILPVYVAATFTFTAIAAHWLWPSADSRIRTLPGTAPATVRFEVAKPSEQEAQASQKVVREKRSLPEPKMLMAPPETGVPSADAASSANYDFQPTSTEGINQRSSLQKQSDKVAITGARIASEKATEAARADLTQKTHLSKEVWVKKIIAMIEAGELEKARIELTEFKQVYPDYPINEQIEAIRP